MVYTDSEARWLDQAELDQATFGQTAPQTNPTILRPIEGGHLDERARDAVSPSMIRAMRLLATAGIALLLAGGLRIALMSGTVGMMQMNAATTANIQEARELNDELRNERSLLSSADRITLIATQQLGMVYASDARPMSID